MTYPKMSRPVRTSLVTLGIALAFACPSFGQAAADEESANPVVANPNAPKPATPAPKPKHDRVVGNSLAASLAASMPKYSPPPKPKPEDENVDLRETDKPKNGIIRLPKYTVQEKKPPVFRERDIYTNKGFADLAKRRYLTPTYRVLNSAYIPFLTASPEEHAMAMYAEDERLQNISDLHDAASTVSKSDAADGAYIKRIADQTYMRTSDFGYERKQP
jgi:hypothetical protein